VIVDTERGARFVELVDAPPAELVGLVGGEQLKFRDEDFALLT